MRSSGSNGKAEVAGVETEAGWGDWDFLGGRGGPDRDFWGERGGQDLVVFNYKEAMEDELTVSLIVQIKLYFT